MSWNAALQLITNPHRDLGLREHLLAAGAGQPAAPQPLPQHSHPGGSPHQAIDPAIAGTPYQMSAGDGGDGHLSEGRKGRRELSTSKRAAQNRAAQRAFRQRKEEYIKQLKDQVKEFEQLCELYKTLQTENYQLRDYIINLQSRLLETQGEIPPAPAGVDLTRSHGEPSNHPVPQPPQQPQPAEAQQQSPTNNGGLSERQIGELQMAAQAAAAAQHGPSDNNGKHHISDDSFVAGEYPNKHQKVDESPASGQQPSPSYPNYQPVPNAYN
ncbi:uncharacterized protein BDR25DRAFT_132727 [Lindgomyces ingoldianus]|uniref:Uncharacterized protein n=1 Tax=Lindgomyces ingoldianus TaxID=673940 RepID=A0ACB6R2F6_9PLEO|nr:uncharacterized protein BDR25DRAFT_132727 [Lindgomyces ingoldianus]KAF2473509.1 hypothetical protein BDR25DRAFT_132727 [Lindgomyces ingoldianus]